MMASTNAFFAMARLCESSEIRLSKMQKAVLAIAALLSAFAVIAYIAIYLALENGVIW